MCRSRCETRLRRRLCCWCGSWSCRNTIDGTHSSSLSLVDRDWSWGELRERSSRIDRVHPLSQQWCHQGLKGRIKIILIQHFNRLSSLILHSTENQTATLTGDAPTHLKVTLPCITKHKHSIKVRCVRLKIVQKRLNVCQSFRFLRLVDVNLFWYLGALNLQSEKSRTVSSPPTLPPRWMGY